MKQSKAKGREVYVEVHHERPCDWEELIDLVYERLLIDPNGLTTLCVACHDLQHGKEKDNG